MVFVKNESGRICVHPQYVMYYHQIQLAFQYYE